MTEGPTKEEIQALGLAMRSRKVRLTTEESEEKMREHFGHDFGGLCKNGKWETWSPAEKAGHVPKPKLFMPRLPDPENPSWADYQDLGEEIYDQDWFIVGGGESALKWGKHLDGQIVYGINWTTKWFMPTFLQILDTAPWIECVETASMRWLEPSTQRVVSSWLMESKIQRPEKVLTFDMVSPSVKNDASTKCFAEEPSQTMWWAPNSLYMALQVAHWFRPRRIILLGFDWGGRHIFGDGRAHGCRGIYQQKDRLQERLEWLRDEMERRGHVIRHVGPTKLDCFKVVDTVEEALA